MGAREPIPPPDAVFVIPNIVPIVNTTNTNGVRQFKYHLRLKIPLRLQRIQQTGKTTELFAIFWSQSFQVFIKIKYQNVYHLYLSVMTIYIVLKLKNFRTKLAISTLNFIFLKREVIKKNINRLLFLWAPFSFQACPAAPPTELFAQHKSTQIN